jgi:hypothetical protein
MVNRIRVIALALGTNAQHAKPTTWQCHTATMRPRAVALRVLHAGSHVMTDITTTTNYNKMAKIPIFYADTRLITLSLRMDLVKFSIRFSLGNTMLPGG